MNLETFLASLIILGGLIIVGVYLLLKKFFLPGYDNAEKTIRDEFSKNREELTLLSKQNREEVNNYFKNFSDSVEQKLDRMKDTIENRLQRIQEDNTEKLEKMRETVDEKLHATLEKRLGESFKLVGDKLEQVYKGLGEMQSIAVGVGDLKKVLSNIKTKGTYGEGQLANLIEDILTPEQYGKNVATKKDSTDRVEFAIKIPNKSNDSGYIWLPVDAKFPLEDYEKLIDAQEKGDIEGIKQSSKNLEIRIKSEAKDIHDKYLDPPHTTDFGILFVPTESLFAEILKIPGLYDKIRRDFSVTITCPTTIQTILTSFQMVFRTIAVQNRSSEVWALLGAVKTDFGNFGGILEKTHKKLQEVSNTIDDAARKSRAIERRLKEVQKLPKSETVKLLETTDLEIEPEDE